MKLDDDGVERNYKSGGNVRVCVHVLYTVCALCCVVLCASVGERERGRKDLFLLPPSHLLL